MLAACILYLLAHTGVVVAPPAVVNTVAAVSVAESAVAQRAAGEYLSRKIFSAGGY